MKTEHQLEIQGNLRIIPYDPSKGCPAEAALYYECPCCQTFMPSLPQEQSEAHCQCDFLVIDSNPG